SAPGEDMFSQDRPPQPITTLHQLNAALLRLQPSITGIDTSMLVVRGVSLPMLNDEIRTNALTLYNGIKRTEVVGAMQGGLAARVNTHPIAFVYDTHGDKHFPGGPQGTKFSDGKDVVNPFLVQLITPLVG